MMDTDAPKVVIVQYRKNPGECRPFYEISQASKANNDYGATGQSEALDMGGYLYRGTANPTASGTLTSFNSGATYSQLDLRFVSRALPILEVEVDRQIVARNLEEAEELGTQ